MEYDDMPYMLSTLFGKPKMVDMQRHSRITRMSAARRIAVSLIPLAFMALAINGYARGILSQVIFCTFMSGVTWGLALIGLLFEFANAEDIIRVYIKKDDAPD